MDKWVRCLVLVFLVLAPSTPLEVTGAVEAGGGLEAESAWGYAEADAIWDPLNIHEAGQSRQLARALSGTTRQGERIAEAIESGRIQVHVLSESDFDKSYAVVDGSSYALAFSYGRDIFLRANSPSTLSDLIHEGTHALDFTTGFWRGRRILELRAYVYEHQFQKATEGEVQFQNLLEVVQFVSKY